MKSAIVDFPTKRSKVIRKEQLEDPELKNVMECFAINSPATDLVMWT